MIISIPSQTGMYSFAVSGDMLKLITLVVSVLLVIVGYAVVQFATFVLSATPEQFLRIVLFTAFVVGIIFLARVLHRKQVLA